MDGYTATADTTRVYEQPPAIVQQHVGSASADSLQLKILEVLRGIKEGLIFLVNFQNKLRESKHWTIPLQ